MSTAYNVRDCPSRPRRRVCTVSVETVRIVDELDRITEIDANEDAS